MSAEALKPGTVIDARYEVIAQIGSGGMAEVFEVEHRQLGRRCALKLLRAELLTRVDLVERLEREARAMSKLESRHIVSIIDAGKTESGEPYFVMELLRGSGLREILDESGSLSTSRAVELALDVCSALRIAHQAGVIHRDLKPENLFVTRNDDGSDCCKVLDFGVAKLLEENLTLPGTLIGTARYMAPEQITNQASVGPTSDLFALGVILFECLSGQVPFPGDTLESVLFKIVNVEPPALLELRPELPRALCELVMRALAKSPAARPESAEAFASVLASVRALSVTHAGALSVSIEPPAPRNEKRPRERYARVAGTAFGAGLVLGGVLGHLLASREAGVAPAPSVALVRPSAAPSVRAAALVSVSVREPPAAPSSAPPSVGVSRLHAPTKNPQPPSKQLTTASPTAPGAPPLFYPQGSGATGKEK